MYKNINDYELLYLISENNDDAYNDMYYKYDNMIKIEANKLYSKYKYLGISIEDIYQVGLYGLKLAIDNFDEYNGTLFYTFANTFIKREMNTFIRNKNRQKHNILSDSISLDQEIDEEGNTILISIDSGINVANQYENYFNQKRILDLKYLLSPLQSLVFELRLNNFTNKEISKLLNVSYKAVDNSLMGIKARLKKELNKIELF